MVKNIQVEILGTVPSNRDVGRAGEEIACKFLRKKGFKILERNYQKRCGELDVVALKDGELHFFEVKAVRVPSLRSIEAGFFTGHSPEENVHHIKAGRIKLMIRLYLSERCGNRDLVFHFHVLSIFMSTKERIARVKVLKDLIL